MLLEKLEKEASVKICFGYCDNLSNIRMVEDLEFYASILIISTSTCWGRGAKECCNE